jgi:predicted dehydrogenase
MREFDRRSFMKQAGATAAVVSLMPEFLTAAPRATGAALPVGVIGVGRQGRAILGELQKLDAARVAAICDVDDRRLSSGQRRAPGAMTVTDHRRVLDDGDIQAVFIATPTHLHRQIATDALEAGKHVYCEAPIASTLDDARAIAQAARGKTARFQAGLLGRSNPIYKLAFSFYRSDAVRELISMRAQYLRKTTWRTFARDPERDQALNWRLDPEVSIGLAGEIGTHQFDVVQWFLNEYPSAIHGSGTIRLHDDGREIPDTVHCGLAFPNGAHLQYHATLANSFEGQHEVFHGSNSAIKLAWTAGWMFKEADAPTQGWEVYANREQFHNDEGITLIADATKLAEQGKLKEGVTLPNDPLYYGVVDFLNSILDGQPVPTSADEGMRATAIGILAHQAVMGDTSVTVDDAVLKGA